MKMSWLPFVCLSLVFLNVSAASTGTNSASIQTGYIRVVSNNGTNSPSGLAVFSLRAGDVLVTEAGVPAMPTIHSGRIFVEVGGTVNTGIAVANPNNEDALVSFYFTDGSGRSFGAESFVLPANQHIAVFLTEQPFGLSSSLTGTLTFNSSGPIVAVALRSVINERNELLITTVPVSELGTGFGGTALLIPHFADGDDWTTRVVLINPENSVLSGTVQFYGQGTRDSRSQPTKVMVNGISNSKFDYTIPPRSAFVMVTQRVRKNTEAGSVRIIPTVGSGSPSGLAIFSHQDEGVQVSTASVAALPPAKAFRMYIESAGVFGQIGSIQTGLAISNPSDSRVTVQLDVFGFDGKFTGMSTSLDIPPDGQVAKFANEIFRNLPSPLRGVIKITAPSPVAVTGLRGRYNERGELLMTATPPYDEASAPLTEIYFPHFVSGDGFATQLLLISTGASHSGILSLRSSGGALLPNSLLRPLD